jgi:carbonic anhydrase/acetyltransferase-like protein (isoleucine patch superfamily)
MIAAGTVVAERQQIGPAVLAAGVPARTLKRELSGAALAWTETAAAHYQELRERYLRTALIREENQRA